MSEHHRGAWGAREDPVWWPATITTTDQQTLQQHHQHLINQHHQQQLAAQQQAQLQQHQAAVSQQQQQQQQQHQQQVQQQNDAARSNCATSNAASQQLFSYKMASSFQNNSATTMSGVNVSSANSPYDYRLNMGGMVRQGEQQGMSAPAAGTQWWYTPPQNSVENTQNLHQDHQSNQHQIQQTPPPSNHIQNNQTQSNQNSQQIHVQTPNAKMPRVKADAKPRGRMTAYAFFVQTCREEHKKKHPEESVIFAEFSKKCAERWKTMLDKEKKRFHEMAEKDKKRYDLEMQSYVPPKGVVVGRGKKRKQIKDPNAPKRSLSAFFWFCNDERTKVKARNPEYGVGDIAKELGRKWSDVDSSIKQKYEALAEEDKRRYEREMTEYKKKGKIVQLPPQPIHVQHKIEEDDDDVDDDENE